MTDPDPMTENLTIVAVAIIAIAITVIVTENVPAVLIGAVNIVDTEKPPDHHHLRVTDANIQDEKKQQISPVTRTIQIVNLTQANACPTSFVKRIDDNSNITAIKANSDATAIMSK